MRRDCAGRGDSAWGQAWHLTNVVPTLPPPPQPPLPAQPSNHKYGGLGQRPRHDSAVGHYSHGRPKVRFDGRRMPFYRHRILSCAIVPPTPKESPLPPPFPQNILPLLSSPGLSLNLTHSRRDGTLTRAYSAASCPSLCFVWAISSRALTCKSSRGWPARQMARLAQCPSTFATCPWRCVVVFVGMWRACSATVTDHLPAHTPPTADAPAWRAAVAGNAAIGHAGLSQHDRPWVHAQGRACGRGDGGASGALSCSLS